MRSAERIHAEFIISWEKEFIISQLSSIWCVSWWLDAHRYISCEHDARQALRRRPTASFLPIHSWAPGACTSSHWTLFSRLLCFDCINTLKASTTPHCFFPSDSLLYFFTLLCSYVLWFYIRTSTPGNIIFILSHATKSWFCNTIWKRWYKAISVF